MDAQLINISGQTVQIDGLLKKGIENLANLSQLFDTADNVKKRKIIGSIYPEKVVFDGENFRTTKLNEAVELIYSVDKGFRKKKSGLTEENFDQSTLVAGTQLLTHLFIRELTMVSTIAED